MRFVSNKKAFTLVELLVVMSIIGVLSSTVFASLNSARGRARDAIRKSALNQISKALRLYYENNNTYVVAGTGWVDAGGPSGVGFFSMTGTGAVGAYSTVSVAQGLVNAGLLPSVFRDPSGLDNNWNSIGAAYLINANANNFTVWTSLESPSASDLNTLNNCTLSDYDDFPPAWPANRHTNYCVSN
jgi:prepilin-type N-terminal cleavage/methylation domain-containing protein